MIDKLKTHAITGHIIIIIELNYLGYDHLLIENKHKSQQIGFIKDLDVNILIYLIKVGEYETNCYRIYTYV